MTACLQKALNKYTLLTYKLANPTVNGFESIVLCITPNKNVSRINYVHYNVQKLANLTRNAITGLSEKLTSTSVMTDQKRIALVMLLAEKKRDVFNAWVGLLYVYFKLYSSGRVSYQGTGRIMETVT